MNEDHLFAADHELTLPLKKKKFLIRYSAYICVIVKLSCHTLHNQLIIYENTRLTNTNAFPKS